MKNYIIYTHQSPEITTIEDFQKDPLSLAKSMSVQEILDYTDDAGISNLQRIYDEYDPQEQADNESDFNSGSLSLLKINTRLAIPKIKVNKEPLLSEGNTVVESVDAAAFIAQKLKSLQEDPDFTQIHTPQGGVNGVAKEMYPNLKVWIWCRALSDYDADGAPDDRTELPGTMIDISPFVTMCSTSTAGEGGDFTIDLSAITCEPDPDKGWIMRKSLLSNHDTLSGSDYTYEDLLTRDDKRSQFYFHNIISENDLVFIRFEVLQNETLRKEIPNDFVVQPSEIPGNNYDMIGLVDGCTITANPDSNEVSIGVTGRDMMKVLIEDGAYMYPESFGTNQFVENQENKNLINRLFSTGGLELLSAFVKRPIDYSILFVINQLSNIGIVPDALFQEYANIEQEDGTVKDERSYQYTLDEPGNPETISETLMKGIWQICKFVFDSSIANRRVVDSSISFAQGSLLTYINKVAQEPWVQFYGDTYGDQYHFITRQPPFTREGYLSLIPPKPTPDDPRAYGNIREEDVVSESLQFATGDVFSWYRLRPQAQLNGIGDGNTFAFVPAIYLSRFSDIWGSKPLDVVSNYVNHITYVGDKTERNLGYFDQQVVHDLKFIIDSNAYLPFTRKGSITINGDRRFKKGTIVRHLGTGEVFYVDAVMQTYNIRQGGIDRTTTLTVSRGMVEAYVYGGKQKQKIPVVTGRPNVGDNGIATSNPANLSKGSSGATTAAQSKSQDNPNSPGEAGGGDQLPTYWDIVDTSIEKAYERSQADSALDIAQLNVQISQNWKVNDKVFNFFLKRRQFEPIPEE